MFSTVACEDSPISVLCLCNLFCNSMFLVKLSKLEDSPTPVSPPENYTRNEWRRCENYTPKEWRRCEKYTRTGRVSCKNYTRNECKISFFNRFNHQGFGFSQKTFNLIFYPRSDGRNFRNNTRNTLVSSVFLTFSHPF